MRADRVILKVDGKYYHKYIGGDSFDVLAIAPGSSAADILRTRAAHI